jgi:hypothetical protein
MKGLEESRKAAQEVLKWFAIQDNTQWLLVFDNIDKTFFEEEASYQNTEDSSYDITQYFPRGDTGSIIITTRLPRLISLGSAVPLRHLNVLDALLILEQHVGRSLRRSDSRAALKDQSEIEEWDPGWSLNLRYLRKSRRETFYSNFVSRANIF